MRLLPAALSAIRRLPKKELADRTIAESLTEQRGRKTFQIFWVLGGLPANRKLLLLIAPSFPTRDREGVIDRLRPPRFTETPRQANGHSSYKPTTRPFGGFRVQTELALPETPSTKLLCKWQLRFPQNSKSLFHADEIGCIVDATYPLVLGNSRISAQGPGSVRDVRGGVCW